MKFKKEIQKLNSYLGQLMDLKGGNMEELVIKRENVDILIMAIISRVKMLEEFKKNGREMEE